MTHAQQMPNSGGADSVVAVHLLLSDNEVTVSVDNPERVMEELQARASTVSSVLEGILLEPHGRPDWGLND